MSVAQSLNEITRTSAFSTKWPNDVMGKSGKTSGILCERFGNGVIVGVGINVSTLKEELPVDSATSIYIETGEKINRNILLVRILEDIATKLAKWESGFDFLDDYRKLSSTINSLVTVTLPAGRSIESKAVGISETGGLILANGITVSTGDVVHLRNQLK